MLIYVAEENKWRFDGTGEPADRVPEWLAPEVTGPIPGDRVIGSSFWRLARVRVRRFVATLIEVPA